MKMLFEKFVVLLDQYAEDAHSVTKRAIQEQSIKNEKLDLGHGLRNHIEQEYLQKNDIDKVDCHLLLGKIQEIQDTLAKKRKGRKIESGYFDALLVWMTDSIHAWETQSALPLTDQNVQSTLSDTQRFIKNRFDEFIVLMGGFSHFPDNRNMLERWSKYHPRVALYPTEDGWDEKTFSAINSCQMMIDQMECLKQATLFQLRHQAEDQVKNDLYYITLSELLKISPTVYPMAQLLTEKFDLKPLALSHNENILKKIKTIEKNNTVIQKLEQKECEKELGVGHEKSLPIEIAQALPIEEKEDDPFPALGKPMVFGSPNLSSNQSFHKKGENPKTFAEIVHPANEKAASQIRQRKKTPA